VLKKNQSLLLKLACRLDSGYPKGSIIPDISDKLSFNETGGKEGGLKDRYGN
jgi:hypothetical protein